MISLNPPIALHETPCPETGTGTTSASALWGGLLVFAVVFVNEANFRAVDVEQFSFDWQIGMRLAVCAVCGLYGLAHLPRTLPYLTSPPGIWATLFGVWTLLTVPQAVNVPYSAAACIALWCFIVAAPAILLHAGPQRVLTATIAALIVYLIGGWIVFFVNPELGRSLEPGESWERFGGLNHPNGTGRQAALAVGLLLVAGATRVWRWRALLLPILFAAFCLIMTNSRTSTCAALAAGVMMLLPRGKRLGPVMLVAVAVAGLGLVLVATQSFDFGPACSSLSRTGDADEIYTLTGRTELWQFCVEKIRQSPIVGYGYGCTRFVISGEYFWSTHHAHNVHLNVMVGTGLIGGALLAGMFVVQITNLLIRPHPFPDVVTTLVLVGGIGDVVMFSPIPESHTLLWLMAMLWRTSAAGGIPLIDQVPLRRN